MKEQSVLVQELHKLDEAFKRSVSLIYWYKPTHIRYTGQSITKHYRKLLMAKRQTKRAFGHKHIIAATDILYFVPVQ